MKSHEYHWKKAPHPTPGLRLADVDTDDGPRPMRNCRPGTKNANAADLFWSDHQEEHEKRAETPTRFDVQEHNKVPRLGEPLNKMAALSKIKTSGTLVSKQNTDEHKHRTKSSESICQQCAQKLRILEKRRRHKTHMSRHKTHMSHSQSKKQDLMSRIIKSNTRQKTIDKTRISKSGYGLGEKSKKCRCRYCMRVTNKGTCTNIVFKEASTLTGIIFVNKDAKRVTADTDGSNTPNGSAKTEYTNSQNSVISSVHSGSYKSNLSHMSLDHEPMVTNE